MEKRAKKLYDANALFFLHEPLSLHVPTPHSYNKISILINSKHATEKKNGLFIVTSTCEGWSGIFRMPQIDGTRCSCFIEFLVSGCQN